MNEKYAHIPQIKGGIIFSDPWYGPDVWCQYRNEFSDKDWLMKMESQTEDGSIYVNLTLGNAYFSANLTTKEAGEDLQLYYPNDLKVHEVELGIDTAKIFCGSMDNWNAWREEGAIHTGADGMFGNLLVFHRAEEKTPVGFLLLAGLDGTFASEKELFQTLCASFDGQEITKEQYTQLCQSYSLNQKIRTAAEQGTTNDGVSPAQAKESQDHER